MRSVIWLALITTSLVGCGTPTTDGTTPETRSLAVDSCRYTTTITQKPDCSFYADPDGCRTAHQPCDWSVDLYSVSNSGAKGALVQSSRVASIVAGECSVSSTYYQTNLVAVVTNANAVLATIILNNSSTCSGRISSPTSAESDQLHFTWTTTGQPN